MQFQSVRHVTITIHCAPERVYDFVSDPRNLPAWASGLSTSIENVDGRWVADSPLGRVSIRFAPRNELGVLDHDVTLESGVTVHNPMRVLPNPSGRGATTTGEAARAPRGSPHTENGKTSEVVFTMFRKPGVSDAKFERDARTVTGDLEVLKRTLEREATTR